MKPKKIKKEFLEGNIVVFENLGIYKSDLEKDKKINEKLKTFLKSKSYKPAHIKIVEENIFKINYEVKSEHRNFLIAER